jgi:hypothetical protein
VVVPLVRLAVVALVLALLIGYLQLPEYFKNAAWDDRTLLALGVILTFCVAALMNTSNAVLSVLKDVVLVVVGFYFGASKPSGGNAPAPRPGDQNPPPRQG